MNDWKGVESLNAKSVQGKETEKSALVEDCPAARGPTFHRRRYGDHRAQEQEVGDRAAMSSASKSDREASAAGVASQCQWTSKAFVAKKLNKVRNVIFQPPDIIHIPAAAPGLETPAQIGQNHGGGATLTYSGGERVIPGAMVGQSMNENEQALAGRGVDAVGQFRPITRLIALELGNASVGD